MDKFLLKKSNNTPKSTEEVSSRNDDEKSETKISSKRKFGAAWLNEFPWLQNNNGCAYCVPCDKKLANHVSYLRKHASLPLHVQNVETKKRQIKINSYKSAEKNNLVKPVYHAELALVMFIICHNLPFLLMDCLPALLAECCPDSKIAINLKCGRSKATQLTEMLGSKAKNDIVSKLQSSKFSLIVDETTDISTKKSLVLVVRYVDNLSKSIYDRFLSLIEVISSDAQSLYTVIKNFLENHNIPLENVIGLATDLAPSVAKP